MNTKCVRMLKLERGSPDGLNVLTYDKDKIYCPGDGMSDALAEVFVGIKSAEYFTESKAEEVPENKKEEVPENKGTTKKSVFGRRRN